MEVKHSALCPVSGGYTDCHCGHPMPRAFSKEQLAHIAAREKECAEHGCDDNGHKHD